MTNMNTTDYSDAYENYGSASFAALSADNQWQRELDFQNIDRYSPEARGVAGSGSLLRLLYEKKLQADEALRDTAETLRADGRESEIAVIDEL